MAYTIHHPQYEYIERRIDNQKLVRTNEWEGDSEVVVEKRHCRTNERLDKLTLNGVHSQTDL